MLTLIHVLYAETLKLKRTLALLLVLIAPLSVTLLQFAAYISRRSSFVDVQGDMWVRLTTNNIVLWALLMLPLFISLETALLNGLEHGGKMWKQIYTLPVPRWTTYAAKQIVALALIGLSTLILFVLIIVSGLLLRVIDPNLAFNLPIPLDKMFIITAVTFLGCWLILSLHFWISARWPSFVVALGVGIVAVTASVILMNSDYVEWYPWTLPGISALNYVDGKAMLVPMLIGLVGGIVVSIIGGWEVTRREVA